MLARSVRLHRPLVRRFRVAWVAAVMAGMAAPLVAAAPARADAPRDSQMWVLNALHVQAAWRITKGRGVRVAVIDSGVDPAVSDLVGSVRTGKNLSGVQTPPSDPNWGVHGTWMASLIAGHGHGPGGSDGILGVAPEAQIYSIRVIADPTDPNYRRYERQSSQRGQAELAKAIKDAVRAGAEVISMSLGYQAPSLEVRSALTYAMEHNVVIVASSGNSGTVQTSLGHGHAPYSFPANYPGVIGVAAVGQSGLPAYFSSGNLSVSVAAPGVNVPAEGRGDKYWLVSGTSPACALTAGVVALVRARYPSLSAAQVRRAITMSTLNRPRAGYDDEIGFGIVDAAAALTAAGRLAKEPSSTEKLKVRPLRASHFGGGPAAVPRVPVPQRSKTLLAALIGLTVAALVMAVVSFWRFGLALRTRRFGMAGSGWAGVSVYPSAPAAWPPPDRRVSPVPQPAKWPPPERPAWIDASSSARTSSDRSAWSPPDGADLLPPGHSAWSPPDRSAWSPPESGTVPPGGAGPG